MPINISVPDLAELKPRITVFGVGGGGCNAVNNMINSNLTGVEFVVANTDAQALANSPCERKIQMGVSITQGLGAGSQPEIGAVAAEESKAEIEDHLSGSHMVFITAGMGGGTGTGAAPVIASLAREHGILTVGVVTKPFDFEGRRRMAIAEAGIDTLAQHVDTLIVIPNQNLFRVANEATSFTAAFQMADQVLFSGVASITELMTKEGLINLDFADVRAVMSDMGKAMMGTGEASGEARAEEAALAAISNPLLDIDSMAGARGVLISIAGGPDLTLYEVDQAASRIREEVDPEANIIVGATIEEDLEGTMRVSVVATGLLQEAGRQMDESTAPAQGRVGMSPTTGMGPAGTSGGFYGGGSPRPVAEPVEMVAEPQEKARKKEEKAPSRAEQHVKPVEEMPEDNGQAPSMMLPLEEVGGEVKAEEAAIPMAPEQEKVAENGVSMEQPRAQQPAPKVQPQGAAPREAGVVPGIEDLPAPIRRIAEEKQQAIQGLQPRGNSAASGPRKRDFLFGKVKEIFGRAQEASPSPKQAAPQPRVSAEGNTKGPSPAAGNIKPQPLNKTVAESNASGAEASPLGEDDDLSIPAFLRRSR